MAKEIATGTARQQRMALGEQALPDHRMAELLDWADKGRVDQAEETLRRRVEDLQAPLKAQLGQLRSNQEKLIDRFSETNSKRLEELRSGQIELGTQVHALQDRQLSDEIQSRQWQFLTKYALPILTALVFSLFAWVWNSHSTLVQLQGMHHAEQGRLDALVGETKDRYTAQKAEDDFRYFENKMANADAKLTMRLDTIDDRLRKHETSPK